MTKHHMLSLWQNYCNKSLLAVIGVFIIKVRFYSVRNARIAARNARIASAVLATAIPSVRLSVCRLSVCLSVRHTPVLCQNDGM